jgi:hypothetical protein
MTVPSPDRRRGTWTALVAATCLVAAGLRVAGLGSQLWYDEIVTLVISARLPVAQIVTEFADLNVHPLYSVLAHASLAVVGDSPFALRLPAAVFGVACVALTAVLAMRVLSRAEAWAAAAMLAVSYHHIWFSQNARGYTLMAAATLVATYALLRALDHVHRGLWLSVYAVACVAGVYTHLTMAFVVAAHAAVVAGVFVVRRSPPRAILPYVVAFAAATVLSLALYLPYLAEMPAVLASKAPPPNPGVGTTGWAVREALRAVLSGSGLLAATLAVVLGLAGGLSLVRRAPLLVWLLVFPAVTTAAAVVIIGLPLRPRFFFFLSSAVAIFIARGLGAAVQALAARWPAVASRPATGVVAGTLGIAVLSTPALARNYELPKQDFDGAVAFLEAAEARGMRIAIAGPACDPFDLFGRHYGKSWGCVKTAADWHEAGRSGTPTLVAYTLVGSVSDAALQAALRSCHVVSRFPATLGAGEIVVCEAWR